MKHEAKSRKRPDGRTPPLYEERIVSFIDVLGFAKEVEDSDDQSLPALYEKISRFRQAFRDDDVETGEDSDLLVLFFSDSMLRAHRIEHSPLFSELIEIVHGISKIVFEGHLVRGAMTHGRFFYDAGKNILISPAFIDGYRTEQTQAVVPRVIVNPSTLREFKKRQDWWKDTHDYEHEAEFIYKLLRLDRDGYYFVDYLKAICNELDHPQYEYPDFLRRHQKVIVDGLESSISIDVRKKLIWLGHYHNAVRSEFENNKDGPYGAWLDGTEIPHKLLHL